MKKILLIISLFLSICIYAQIPAYYNNVNLTLTGMALKAELAQKITVTHTNQISYSGVWTALKQTDLDPNNSANVLLLYGYNDTDGNTYTDRTRSKNSNGGSNGDWNREHTYAKSLATPNMTTASPGAGTDAHHIRAADVQRNGSRGSRKFATGSGNSGVVGYNWYPGDEWKGDVARMMMYMYLRYPTQCLPINVGVGTSVAIDPSMITLFLQWNVEDTVSQYEKNRNTILQNLQGNRNPFIDNPYLATIIWGGTPAKDNWNMVGINEHQVNNTFQVYPVPSNTGDVNIQFTQPVKKVNLKIFSIDGKLVRDKENLVITGNTYKLNHLSKGVFILKIATQTTVSTKKIVIN